MFSVREAGGEVMRRGREDVLSAWARAGWSRGHDPLFQSGVVAGGSVREWLGGVIINPRSCQH